MGNYNYILLLLLLLLSHNIQVYYVEQLCSSQRPLPNYRLTIYRNEDVTVDTFLTTISKTVDSLLNTYEKIIIIGDININSLQKDSNGFKKLKDFCDAYDLKNLISAATCFQAENPTSLDLILTNKNRSFIKSKSVTTGISDHHSMVTTMLRTHVTRLNPVEVKYRSFRKFNENAFLSDLQSTVDNLQYDNDKESFTSFFEGFENVIDKHAPIKTVKLRGNDAPFITPQFRREIRYQVKIAK